MELDEVAELILHSATGRAGAAPPPQPVALMIIRPFRELIQLSNCYRNSANKTSK